MINRHVGRVWANKILRPCASHPCSMAQVHQYRVEPISQFANINAAIRRPREIAYFSYDEDHKWRNDASSIRYYYPPSLPADLSEGFGTFRQLDDTGDDHLDGLLDAVIAHEKKLEKKLETDVITWRGMMTKIMIVPFSHLDDWEMNATCFQGTIYIEEDHSKKLESRNRQHNTPAGRGAMSQDLMSFWGYKFEAISLLNQPWAQTSRAAIEGRQHDVVSNYAQYCSIVRTGFGGTKMVIGGEVDAVETSKPEDASLPTDWVELKTSAEIQNHRDQVKFERKLLKFWAQSFLLGVPKIIVGFRTQQGYLQRLEELDVQSIPDKVTTQGDRLWDGQTCINFAASFLEWLKTTVTGDGTWRIRKRQKVPFLEVFRIEESGTGDILSEAFLRWRNHGLQGLLHQKAELDDSKHAIVNDEANGHEVKTDTDPP